MGRASKARGELKMKVSRKKKSGVREVYQNGVLVGWQAWARSWADQVIEAFIPRPDDEIEEDRRCRALH
jgi:hypothetical protein